MRKVAACISVALLGPASSLPALADTQAYYEQQAAQQKNADKYWKENLKAQKKCAKQAQKAQKVKLKKANKNRQAAF